MSKNTNHVQCKNCTISNPVNNNNTGVTFSHNTCFNHNSNLNNESIYQNSIESETDPINEKNQDTLGNARIEKQPQLFKSDLNLLHQQSQVANSANQCANNTGCIIERLGHLCLNESLSDIYFVVGSEQERIPVHKLVLSIGSQVFMAMFYGTGCHMKTNGNEIVVPDVEVEPFKNMLKYLYTDELCVDPDSVMSTLYVSKKYAVAALERECVDFLKENLKADIAFMLLEQARLFDEHHLADLCLEIIDKYSMEAFSSECFLEIDRTTLVSILKRDTLSIREFDLYKFVLQWAKSQCVKQNHLPVNVENQKLVLEDAIDFIRFPLMSKEEFAILMNDTESRILDSESVIEIFIYLTFMGINSLTGSIVHGEKFNVKKLKYNDTQRCFLGGKEQSIGRFSQVESRWGYSGTSDRIKFSVNRRIFVIGFGLYGSIYGKCEYQAIIQLIHFDSCTTCAQNTTSFICDGTNKTFRVLFKEPVEIVPDNDYIALATLKGPDSFYGTKGGRKISHDKVTFQFQYASGNNNGTSVEDGQIPEILFLYSN